MRSSSKLQLAENGEEEMEVVVTKVEPEEKHPEVTTISKMKTSTVVTLTKMTTTTEARMTKK